MRQTGSPAAWVVSRETLACRWVSERGLRLSTGSATLPACQALRLADLPEIEELVPADDSLLVVLRAGAGPSPALLEILNDVAEARPLPSPGREHLVPVRFDGQDLHSVAERTGLAKPGLIELLLDLRLNVRFLGFQPGFAYLDGLPPQLHLPRLQVPRKRVPAGSFSLAGGYCGFYPAAGPGGWLLLGSTQLKLFDPAATPPARFQPGDRVRLVAA